MGRVQKKKMGVWSIYFQIIKIIFRRLVRIPSEASIRFYIIKRKIYVGANREQRGHGHNRGCVEKLLFSHRGWARKNCPPIGGEVVDPCEEILDTREEFREIPNCTGPDDEHGIHEAVTISCYFDW